MSSRSSAGDSTTTSGPSASSSSASRSRRSTRRSHGLSVSGPATSSSTLAAPGAAWRRRPCGPAASPRTAWAAAPAGGWSRAGRRRRGCRTTPGAPTRRASPDHAGQAEDPLLVAVGVEPDDVPAAGVADHAPGLEVARRAARRVAGALVVELDRLAGLRGVPEHVERRLVGAQPRLDEVEGRDVDLDAGGGQLADGVGGRLGEPGVLPDPGGQPDHGRLVGGQPDVGQREVVGRDAVAGLVVEERVDAADLDRHAEASAAPPCRARTSSRRRRGRESG